MTVNDTLFNFISHIAPPSLVKNIFPLQNSIQTYSYTDQQEMPWIDVDLVELTQEDFL